MDLNIETLISDFELFASENGYALPPGAIMQYIDKASPLRFSKNGGRDSDSFAYLHSNGVGTLGDWHNFEGSQIVYNFYTHTGTPISEEERKALEVEAKEQSRRAEEEKESLWHEMALKCSEEFKALPIVSEPFGYFETKGFRSLVGNIGHKADVAVIPFYDEKGHISTLQYIHPDGKKIWKPGAKKGGAFFPLGLNNVHDRERFFRQRVFMCEGVATALSVYLATNSPTIAVGDVGNYINISRLFPNSVIIADYDVPSHIGETKAQETGNPIIIMSDPEDLNKSFDADDFRREYGLEKLGERIFKDYEPFFQTLSQFRNTYKFNGYIVKNVVNESSINCIFGPSNTGKTYIMLDLALSVATRQKAWHGAKIHGGMVLYFCAEGQAALPQRIDAWCNENGVKEETLDSCFLLRGVPDNLSDGEKIKVLLSEIEALPETPILICLDTFIRFLEGDEKDSQDVIRLLNNLEDLNKKGIAIFYTNHPGKNPNSQDTQTGSYRNRTNIDNEFILTYIDDETVSLQHSKSRNGRFYEMTLSLPIVIMGTDEDGDEITQRVVKTVKPISLMAGKPKKEKAEDTTETDDYNLLIYLLAKHQPPLDELQGEIKIERDEARGALIEYFSINGVQQDKISQKVKDSLVTSKPSWFSRLQKKGYISSFSGNSKVAVCSFVISLDNLPGDAGFLIAKTMERIKRNKGE